MERAELAVGPSRIVRLLGMAAVLAVASCQTTQCQQGGGSPSQATPQLQFVQTLSSGGALVESYRFDSVRRVPIPDSYSALGVVPGAKVVADHRNHRVLQVATPTGAGTSSVRAFELQPLSGLITSAGVFTINGELIALHPSGRFLVTREPGGTADPTHSQLHVRSITAGGSVFTIGAPVTTPAPPNARLIFSNDGATVYIVSGAVRRNATSLLGQVDLTKCPFDATTGAIGACDTPAVTINMQSIATTCPGGVPCVDSGYEAESLALDPQMRLLYFTAVASIARGGSITFFRETWAVRVNSNGSLPGPAQRLPRSGALFAEPHGLHLLVGTDTKLESWAIDAASLQLTDAMGGSGLGEPQRLLQGPLSVDCDQRGVACAIFGADRLQLFLWDPATLKYVRDTTPLPGASDNLDVWVVSGDDPIRIWPQNLVVGSRDQPRVDAINFDLLGAIQSRFTQSLSVQGREDQPVETIGPSSETRICVAQIPNPLSNVSAWAQSFYLSSTGTLSRADPLPTNGGQVATALDPGRRGVYELADNERLTLSNRTDCSGSSGILGASVTGLRPRNFVLDPLGRRAYVITQFGGRVTTIPLDRFRAAAGLQPFLAGSEVQVVPVGLNLVSDMKIDERGERLFITVGSRDELYIVDLDADGVPQVPPRVLSTGDWPGAVAISRDSKNLYVYNVIDRTISHFGAAPAFADMGTTPLPALSPPAVAGVHSSTPHYGFEVASTGQLLYVADYDADQVQFWGISDTDGSLTLRSSVPMPHPGALYAFDRRF
jgi:6-phosphogluconolactonase (cycloisomerase 2 family)